MAGRLRLGGTPAHPAGRHRHLPVVSPALPAGPHAAHGAEAGLLASQGPREGPRGRHQPLRGAKQIFLRIFIGLKNFRILLFQNIKLQQPLSLNCPVLPNIINCIYR